MLAYTYLEKGTFRLTDKLSLCCGNLETRWSG